MFVQLIFSPSGGTRKAAEIMASEWDGPIETVDLSDPSVDFSKYRFGPEDTALIAVPSYYGRVPALAAARLSQINGNGAKGVLLCVYGNRAYDDTMIEMKDIAEDCGFIVTAAVATIAEHSIMRQFASGRPDEEDKKRLQSYARAAFGRIKDGTAEGAVEVPGNRPYREAGSTGLIPKASQACMNCGLCARQCPAQAIDDQNAKKTDSQKCISCMRCAAICPHSARKVNKGMVALVSLALKKACADRKECEMYDTRT